ncbi:MAG: 30S ribosomal protein S8 [Proteobacteria bacterium]|nr:30S ribosomal protein S8 [Pseudomonadota bacterium]
MDVIADMLTIIRNGCKARKNEVVVPHSKLKENILEVMKREGFIPSYEVVKIGNHNYLKIFLGYDNKRKPIINNIVRISKPGRRIYTEKDEIVPVRRGLGVSILSTSKGLMTDKEAIEKNVGGEVICKIW